MIKVCRECKEEFEAKGNTLYCVSCRPKVKARKSKESLTRCTSNKVDRVSTKDVTHKFNTNHMFDIIDMCKKIKRKLLKEEDIYKKYERRYGKQSLEKYISRVMEE